MSDNFPQYPPAPPPAPPPPPPPPAWQPPPIGAPAPYGATPHGQQPPFGAEPPPAPPRHSAALILLVTGAVALVISGVTIAAWVTLKGDGGPSYPDDWDPRVEDIAQFVQTERGVLFEHPVYVDFLTDEEFTADVTTSEDELTDEDRASLEQAESTLRALGLVSGDVDLFEQQNQLTGEGVAAYYDPDTKRIRVRGTELTPDLRVTLAHELTHALQDQFVDLNEVEADLTEDESSRYRAVVEGDASNVEDAYVDEELTDAEYDDYVSRSAEISAGVDLDGVPPATVALFDAPYAIGPSFDRIVINERGSIGLNNALREPPASDLQLLDPRAYFADRGPEDVDIPEHPDDQAVIEEGEFGTFDWYIVLASRIDPKQALNAVDGWAGDSYVSYESPSGTCVAARFLGQSPQATADMKAALDAWVAFSPSDASVTSIDDRTVQLTSCDPGADAAAVGAETPVENLLAPPATRLVIAADLQDELDLELEAAWCVADGVVDQLTMEQLASREITDEMRQIVSVVMATCGVTPR
jgi:hypothetical protein